METQIEYHNFEYVWMWNEGAVSINVELLMIGTYRLLDIVMSLRFEILYGLFMYYIQY